jgi:hypothetical protein
MMEDQRIKVPRDTISDTERLILEHLCERIKPKDESEDENESASKIKRESISDLGEKVSDQEGFLLSFLTFLYSSNYPRESESKGFGPRDLLPKDKDDDEDKAKNKKTNVGVAVNHLIDWLVAGHFYKPIRSRSDIGVRMTYLPIYLVRSVAGQLSMEYNTIYRSGRYELHKKVCCPEVL